MVPVLCVQGYSIFHLPLLTFLQAHGFQILVKTDTICLGDNSLHAGVSENIDTQWY